MEVAKKKKKTFGKNLWKLPLSLTSTVKKLMFSGCTVLDKGSFQNFTPPKQVLNF